MFLCGCQGCCQGTAQALITSPCQKSSHIFGSLYMTQVSFFCNNSDANSKCSYNEWMVFHRRKLTFIKVIEMQIHPNPIILNAYHHWCGIQLHLVCIKSRLLVLKSPQQHVVFLLNQILIAQITWEKHTLSSAAIQYIFESTKHKELSCTEILSIKWRIRQGQGRMA